jgi:uncharacterized membrane protein YeaQ/YmgE (transglycosylase-associated protein family)
MFHLIGMVVFGLVIGALAKLLMPGKDPGGILITVLVGVVGSLVGGFLGRLMGLYQQGQPAGWFMSLIGAVLLLWVYRMATRKKAES